MHVIRSGFYLDQKPENTGGFELFDEEDYVNNPLWPILIETVHTITMYPHHKYYVQSVFLNDRPNATPQDLAFNLGISLGEAMVILHEFNTEKQDKE